MKISELFHDQIAPHSEPYAIMVVDYAHCAVTSTEWSERLNHEVLARAEQITSVATAEEQNKAVEAQAGLARAIRAWQTAEAKIKEPLNEIRGKVIAMSKANIAELDEAGSRIGKLCANYQLLEMKRTGAARRLQDETLAGLSRERDEKLSKAQSVAEIEAIEAEYRQVIADSAPPVPPVPKAAGQVVAEQWNVQIVDIWLLARAHPSCVKIEPRLTEIKALLNAGIKVAGVTAQKETKSTVRLKPEQKAIEV
jgi:hypothetical protein